MVTQELVATHSAPEQTQSTKDLRASTVKLFEIGTASTETKGTVRGLEWGYTPHS
jgi:hypothetical protein